MADGWCWAEKMQDELKASHSGRKREEKGESKSMRKTQKRRKRWGGEEKRGRRRKGRRRPQGRILIHKGANLKELPVAKNMGPFEQVLNESQRRNKDAQSPNYINT